VTRSAAYSTYEASKARQTTHGAAEMPIELWYF